MKWTIRLMMMALMGLLWSCGTTSKTRVSPEKSVLLDELIAENSFRIESDWAQPLATGSMNQLARAGLIPPGSTAGNISLIGNTNYLVVRGDTVAAYLPYFGERQMGGGYSGSGSGIEFKGVPQNYSVTERTSGAYDVQFSIKGAGTESFQLRVRLFPNLKSTITVTSTHRFPISYQGDVGKLKEVPGAGVE